MDTHHSHITPFQKLLATMRTLFNFHSRHVKISETGMNVLKNRQLTRNVVDAVIEKKKELDNGESVTVEAGKEVISVSLSGSLESPKERQ